MLVCLVCCYLLVDRLSLRHSNYIIRKIPICASTIGLDVTTYLVVPNELDVVGTLNGSINYLIAKFGFSLSEDCDESHGKLGGWSGFVVHDGKDYI